MPQLDKATARKAHNAESQDRKPLDEGVYTLVLKAVEPKQGRNGPGWNWEFRVVEGETGAGKPVFEFTSLNDDALWKIHDIFAAFEVREDTHTDKLLGKKVKAVVIQRPIGNGPRKGQITNEVSEYMPVGAIPESNDDDWGDGPAGDDDEPPF